MLWAAMAPLLLLALAVGTVPVVMGMVHDHRARRGGLERSDLFFLPPAPAAGRRQADVEAPEDDHELKLRLERVETTLAKVMARIDAGAVSPAPEGA
jgi:hypothetical protein